MIERFFIEQSMKKIELTRFVKKQLEMAGFTDLEIVKTPLVTRIVLLLNEKLCIILYQERLLISRGLVPRLLIS